MNRLDEFINMANILVQTLIRFIFLIFYFYYSDSNFISYHIF